MGLKLSWSEWTPLEDLWFSAFWRLNDHFEESDMFEEILELPQQNLYFVSLMFEFSGSMAMVLWPLQLFGSMDKALRPVEEPMVWIKRKFVALWPEEFFSTMSYWKF